jgi:hypothetical protein
VGFGWFSWFGQAVCKHGKAHQRNLVDGQV